MKSMVCITGASGGLGRAFAAECAARGWNLYLTDLHKEKLEILARGLSRCYGVEVLTDPRDLLQEDDMDAFWSRVDGLGIRFQMLVNVAGLDFEGPFLERSLVELSTIIRLNIEATVAMTRRVLQFRNSARCLHIINVASLAGFYPMPLKTVYAASKRFLVDFSRALHQELRPENVRVLAVCPAGLATKRETIRSIQSQGFMGRLTTEQIGRVAAQTLNRALRGRSVFIPGWSNQLLRALSGLVPADTLARLIVRRWSKTHSRVTPAPVGQYNQGTRILAESVPTD